MIFLGLKTDSPVAEFYLYENETLRAETSWQADRELARNLIEKLERFLAEHGTNFAELGGVFGFRGPGSFTGLRIGLTVINTIAYANQIPVVGEQGEQWNEVAVRRLLAGENDEIILPHYGADPRITAPKK